MHKAMFVAYLQAGYPPFAHIGVIAIGNVNTAPAADAAFIAVVKILQAVQVVEVPKNRGMFPVDFESVKRLVAAGVACGLKSGQGTVLESCQEGAGVIDANFFPFAGRGVFALLNKILVMALTLAISPLSQRAVSMQCASKSPVTPLPAT